MLTHNPKRYTIRSIDEEVPVFTMSRLQRSSPIAQLVEQMTVNHWVPGSSPGRGASVASIRVK